MPTRGPALIPRIQRGIDIIVGAAMAVAGAAMLAGFTNAVPPTVERTLLEYGALVWAVVLTMSSAAALAGVLLRSDRPGRRQSVAFALELGGWPFCALCVGLYTVANVSEGGSAAGVGALIALTASLAGKYLRRLAAIALAKQGCES